MNYSFPREILKWLQSMDLSISIQNIRRDFANGYVYAETISKYYPGSVSMHSFENSHKSFYRDDNWKQLEIIFAKHRFNFRPEEYNKIKDYDTDQTIEFTSKLYTKLTNRMIEIKKRIHVANSDEKTKTLLLTETGLDNIDLKEKRIAMLEEIEQREPGYDQTESFEQNASNIKNKTDTNGSSNLLVSKTELNKMMETSHEPLRESQKSILSGKFNTTKKGSTFILKTKQRLAPDYKPETRTNRSRFNDIQETTTHGYKPINERLNELLHKVSDDFDNECFLVVSDDELAYYNFSNVVNSFSEEFLRAFLYEVNVFVI